LSHPARANGGKDFVRTEFVAGRKPLLQFPHQRPQSPTTVTRIVGWSPRISHSRWKKVPALAIPLQDITSSNGIVPRNYDSFFVTPGLRVKLAPSQRVSPWLSAGGGYALFDESANRMDGTHNTTRGTSGGALQFGGGVDIRTPIKVLFPIGLRAEVRDLYTAKPNYNVSTGGGFQHNVVLSGGIVLHF